MKETVEQIISSFTYNENKLIPAIAQQYDTKEVLMMAWMTKDSLIETLKTKQVCYWSRSRQELWRKGETSGHRQTLKDLFFDCDQDTILLFVDQKGPACHTNRRSCFYHKINGDKVDIIDG